jgi:hypothetical protein
MGPVSYSVCHLQIFQPYVILHTSLFGPFVGHKENSVKAHGTYTIKLFRSKFTEFFVIVYLMKLIGLVYENDVEYMPQDVIIGLLPRAYIIKLYTVYYTTIS